MRIKVVPRAGLTIRDPAAGDRLPVEGRDVDDTKYWRRLAEAGDVTIVDKPAAPVGKKAKE